MGNKASNLIEEFCGHLFATAVTVYGVNSLLFFSMMIFPTASVVPNSLLATSSESTIEAEPIKQVVGLPLRTGKEKKEKKLESTLSRDWDFILVPVLISAKPPFTRTKDF